MRSRVHGVVLLALATSGVIAFACGGASTNTASVPPPPDSTTASATPQQTVAATPSVAPSSSVSAPALVIVPMKLDVGSQTMEVHADGTVDVLGGYKIVRFVGADLVDTSHAIAASVAANGTVTFAGTQKTSRFDDKDALEFDGSKIVIADDGTVNVFDAKGKPDSDNGKMKFAGFQPRARRAAALLIAWSQVAAEQMMKNMPKMIASVNRAVQMLSSASAAASSSGKPSKH